MQPLRETWVSLLLQSDKAHGKASSSSDYTLSNHSKNDEGLNKKTCGNSNKS